MTLKNLLDIINKDEYVSIYSKTHNKEIFCGRRNKADDVNLNLNADVIGIYTEQGVIVIIYEPLF